MSPQIPRPRNALAEFVRLHAASRLRISRRRFSHRAGAAHLRRRDFSSPIRCKTKSIGGFFGAASQAGSTRISRSISSSGFLPCCCRAGPNGRASTTVCCAKCGAPAPAWSCCHCKPRRSSATRCIAQVKKGEMVDTGLWCLSRLGARKLFYGPINQVLPVQAATRWVEALLKVPKGRRRSGRDRAAHRRFHARSEPGDHGHDPQTNSRDSAARARRRSGRGSRQSVWRRAAVGLGGSRRSS